MVNTKWWLPQNRERIYIFGRYNGNPSGRKIFPIYNNSKKVDDLQGQYTNTLTARYTGIGNGTYVVEGKQYAQKEIKLKQIGTIGEDSEATRVYDTTCARTIKNGGGMGAKTGLYKVKSKIRRLTPIECERLQGFPDNWTDGQSDTQRYKQCGNAVSVCVTKAIFKEIYK